MLLPRTTKLELWPAILTKGIMKVFNVNLGADEEIPLSTLQGGIVHMLTGWIPETIPWLRIYKQVEAGIADDDYFSGLKGETWSKYERGTKEWTLPEDKPPGDRANRYRFIQK